MELRNIIIDHTELQDIKEEAKKYKDYNFACYATDYWDKRINQTIEQTVMERNTLAYGFVGDGWPYTIPQDFALNLDSRKLQQAYDKEDLNCRDVGDAIYQANVLLDNMVIFSEKSRTYILDFGGGYGRLAIPFLHYLDNITYISIDYPPVSLLIAPQVIKQFFPQKKVLKWDESGNISDFDFVSLPAWRIKDIDDKLFNLFITIHSFQEMTLDAIAFYVAFINSHSSFGRSSVYSINLWPEQYWSANWTPLFDRPFPVNRDGSFNEKLWRVD